MFVLYNSHNQQSTFVTLKVCLLFFYFLFFASKLICDQLGAVWQVVFAVFVVRQQQRIEQFRYSRVPNLLFGRVLLQQVAFVAHLDDGVHNVAAQRRARVNNSLARARARSFSLSISLTQAHTPRTRTHTHTTKRGK